MHVLTNAKVRGSIVPTRDYTTGWFRKRTLKAGLTVILVKKYHGFLGGLTHVSVRDPKTGEFFHEVPTEYFRVS